eukprot:scaffold4649_cov72-Cyclotella_meneghiniana.AAC.10
MHYKSVDYIGKSSQAIKSNKGIQVDAECRAKMVEWCYQVTDCCEFKRESVAIGVSYLDRFMSSNHVTAVNALYSKKDYQLAAMTCLYMAIKLFEPVVFDTALLSEVSHGCYDENEIKTMELDILQGLNWRMNGPTAYDFLHHFIMLLLNEAHIDKAFAAVLLNLSRFQVEIAVSDYNLALEEPSVIALAAMSNILRGNKKFKSVPPNSRSGYFQIIKDLTGVESFRLNSVRLKLLNALKVNSGLQIPQIADNSISIDEEDDMIPIKNTNSLSRADNTMARCA